MQEHPGAPSEIEALPLQERAAAYVAAEQALEARLQLPGS